MQIIFAGAGREYSAAVLNSAVAVPGNKGSKLSERSRRFSLLVSSAYRCIVSPIMDLSYATTEAIVHHYCRMNKLLRSLQRPLPGIWAYRFPMISPPPHRSAILHDIVPIITLEHRGLVLVAGCNEITFGAAISSWQSEHVAAGGVIIRAVK